MKLYNYEDMIGFKALAWGAVGDKGLGFRASGNDSRFRVRARGLKYVDFVFP